MTAVNDDVDAVHVLCPSPLSLPLPLGQWSALLWSPQEDETKGDYSKDTMDLEPLVKHVGGYL